MKKETTYINLWELQSKPEKFLVAKMNIESGLPEEEKLPLVDFISKLGMTSVYSIDGVMIPYSIAETPDSRYVFYVDIDNTTPGNAPSENKNKAFESFVAKLENIDYDFTKLSKKSNAEMFNLEDEGLDPGEYFLIKNQFYK